MNDLCSKFLSLLRYVPYIAEEKPKVQRFLSYLLAIYKDRIKYDDPKTLEEAMRKAKVCYEQNKNRTEHTSSWKEKITDNYNQGRKNNRFQTTGIREVIIKGTEGQIIREIQPLINLKGKGKNLLHFIIKMQISKNL